MSDARCRGGAEKSRVPFLFAPEIRPGPEVGGLPHQQQIHVLPDVVRIAAVDEQAADEAAEAILVTEEFHREGRGLVGISPSVRWIGAGMGQIFGIQ